MSGLPLDAGRRVAFWFAQSGMPSRHFVAAMLVTGNCSIGPRAYAA